ncbi:MAG: CPBP family intramembrane metalloprotease [Scytolyngbya sp. HA4215-MV1]|jgi:hypothetical protein|nr:CPBP family intramembrane metalloprotease [Scytolyngbya sp. HA4215-MV1]
MVLTQVDALVALLKQSSSLVRVGLFFLVWPLIWLPIAVPLSLVLQWQPPKPPTIAQKLPLVLSLYLLAFPVLWGFAWMQAIPFSSYGLQWHVSVLKSLSVGLGLGVLGLVGLFTLQHRLGWLVGKVPNWQNLGAIGLPALGMALGISLTEELVFRGFLPNQLYTIQPGWMVAILSSLIFALLHLVWEGRAGFVQLPGLWLLGLILLLARWVNEGSLGLAWGLHAGWIWGLASLDAIGLSQPSGRAPQWVTGLAGQPLAGMMGILFLLTTGLLLWEIRGLVIWMT